jgi:hypothetical protein
VRPQFEILLEKLLVEIGRTEGREVRRSHAGSAAAVRHRERPRHRQVVLERGAYA